ncbi:MAG: hypothetical protein EB006_07785 [Betaproteobacteria bacterium]|nr:hypothetical protein [Betaproteobacteria bacterium]
MATDKHSSVPEGFKEIPGYGGRYFINENGDVWSVIRCRLMSKTLNAKKMYLTVPLSREGERMRPRLIHHLMAVTWMEKCPGERGAARGKYQINHKDGDKHNNSLDNLEWVKHEQNLRHAWENGLQCAGENRPNAQFTSEEVRQIRLRLIEGEKCKAISTEFGVNIGSVKKIQQYISWKRQDWDLIEPMIKICKSKWLKVTLQCVQDGGRFWDYSRPRVP